MFARDVTLVAEIQFEPGIKPPSWRRYRNRIVAEQRFCGPSGRNTNLPVGRNNAKLPAASDQRRVISCEPEVIAVPYQGDGNAKLPGRVAYSIRSKRRDVVADAVPPSILTKPWFWSACGRAVAFTPPDRRRVTYGRSRRRP